MNDDIIIGKKVLPEDFYSKSKGYKIRLTWPVPNAEGCPMNLNCLLEAYADSLRHVNQLYNEVFGLELRKVPAHAAHLIDIDVVSRMQNTFPHQFDITSSHKIRSSDDMQFAFAYNYFLMSELREINSSEIFDRFDIDNSG